MPSSRPAELDRFSLNLDVLVSQIRMYSWLGNYLIGRTQDSRVHNVSLRL